MSRLVTRSEIRTVATVLVVTGAVASVFPYGASSFRAAADRPVPPPCVAFVTLTPEAEQLALRTAKGTWQMEPASRARQHARLPLGELPEDDGLWTLAIGEMPPPDPPRLVSPDAAPLAPSVAAPAARRLPAQAAAPRPPAFSKEDLLKVD